ncbi:hypothetical protein K438DRAFT_1779906 [Mycena galopus ATCC 62051]|nr:hypothetical protein K438DRAFT_1779906 [Mycena galopus ATCC 62051]
MPAVLPHNWLQGRRCVQCARYCRPPGESMHRMPASVQQPRGTEDPLQRIDLHPKCVRCNAGLLDDGALNEHLAEKHPFSPSRKMAIAFAAPFKDLLAIEGPPADSRVSRSSLPLPGTETSAMWNSTKTPSSHPVERAAVVTEQNLLALSQIARRPLNGTPNMRTERTEAYRSPSNGSVASESTLVTMPAFFNATTAGQFRHSLRRLPSLVPSRRCPGAHRASILAPHHPKGKEQSLFPEPACGALSARAVPSNRRLRIQPVKPGGSCPFFLRESTKLPTVVGAWIGAGRHLGDIF